ncbi:phospholipase D-like domain-containing protein [Mesorhizobium sp. CA8]|uniref:phospholipase D-like domain-containing protein n=1 Tax=Mesorhizobium sp. CA8 TaxID=2876637 RepID=UPI001CCB8D2A|nr:phospholipase D-like domain-containing protein [Mesorhizobium sp. CA8]MBZ9763367.1 phospholipase D-like domain-containing protein [Mesorhizobium sp. CA8]
MRAKASKDGLTLRVITGTSNAVLAMDLTDAKRQGCLGFTIERTDLDTGDRRWLPNMLRFPSDPDPKSVTTARAPLQTFRWGDYTIESGKRYRYRAVARYGSAADTVGEGVKAEKPGSFDVISGGAVVEVKAENSRDEHTAVFFNRGAAASEAYVRKFGNNDPSKIPDALIWLSRGLEEAILAFLAKASDEQFALHAAIYEFQKPNLLKGLQDAHQRGVEVKVVYHARDKGEDDKTREKNEAAIAAAHLEFTQPRKADPQGAIMHDKFVVLLKKGADGILKPVAVWTGSTNWTDGGIYGQLNVGHAVYDPDIADKYEKLFQLLTQDLDEKDSHAALKELTPVPTGVAQIQHGITPIFSPQANVGMIGVYAEVCKRAKVLMVSAPFALHPQIRDVLHKADPGTLRFLMADKEGSFGKKGEIEMMEGDPGNAAAVATVLNTPLNDFQGRLLEDSESFHHAGVHIHSKIIAADPFGTDPILVTGSANFSTNSSTINDSNSLIIRGDTAVMDIYVTEFMRMFEHYWFRYTRAKKEAEAQKKGKTLDAVLSLKEDASWSDPFYAAGSKKMLDRQAFAGIVV